MSGDDKNEFAALSDVEPLSSSCDDIDYESGGDESEVGNLQHSLAYQWSKRLIVIFHHGNIY